MNKRIFLPILFLILALFLIQAIICNFASGERLDIVAVKEEAEKLEKENEALKTEILRLSSLTRVSLAAAELGFSPAKIVYTSFDLPVAMRN